MPCRAMWTGLALGALRARTEKAATAEHLRARVDEQLRRLETLSAELAPRAGEAARPP